VLSTLKMVNVPEELVDTKNGKRWLHTKKIPITDEKGKPIYLLGISEDITEKKRLDDERRQAERTLRENELKLHLILENIGEGVIVADNNQKVVLSNQMAEEILGITELSSSDWEDRYNIYHPDGRTVFPAQDLPLEKALKGFTTNETELVLQDVKTGRKKLVKVTGHPIRDDKNRVIAAVATIKDITKFRQLQKALEESEMKYRKLIGFRWQDAAEKNGAEQKPEEKDEDTPK
jgi:PAS domain S-box-containing protein